MGCFHVLVASTLLLVGPPPGNSPNPWLEWLDYLSGSWRIQTQAWEGDAWVDGITGDVEYKTEDGEKRVLFGKSSWVLGYGGNDLLGAPGNRLMVDSLGYACVRRTIKFTEFHNKRLVGTIKVVPFQGRKSSGIIRWTRVSKDQMIAEFETTDTGGKKEKKRWIYRRTEFFNPDLPEEVKEGVDDAGNPKQESNQDLQLLL